MNAKRKTRKHAESKSNLFAAGALEELSGLFHIVYSHWLWWPTPYGGWASPEQ